MAKVIQWNLRTRDTLRLGFVPCREVVPISEGPLFGGSTVDILPYITPGFVAVVLSFVTNLASFVVVVAAVVVVVVAAVVVVVVVVVAVVVVVVSLSPAPPAVLSGKPPVHQSSLQLAEDEPR